MKKFKLLSTISFSLLGVGAIAAIPLLTTSCSTSQYDKINSVNDVYNTLKDLDYTDLDHVAQPNPSDYFSSLGDDGINYFLVLQSTEKWSDFLADVEDNYKIDNNTINAYVGGYYGDIYVIGYVYAQSKDITVTPGEEPDTFTFTGDLTYGFKGWTNATEDKFVFQGQNIIDYLSTKIDEYVDMAKGFGLNVNELSTLSSGFHYETDISVPFGEIQAISNITWRTLSL